MTAVLSEMMSRPTLLEDLDYLQQELSREKLLREKFIDEVDPSTKAEFINGKIIVHSPAALQHIRITRRLLTALVRYVTNNGLGEAFVEKALCSFPRNDYEPDVCFFSEAKLRGLAPTTVPLPIPDFIAEILSPSTVRNDRGVKLQDYEAHGVGEYWIIDPEEKLLEQYVRDEDKNRYMPARILRLGEEVQSSAVAGFKMAVIDLFA